MIAWKTCIVYRFYFSDRGKPFPRGNQSVQALKTNRVYVRCSQFIGRERKARAWCAGARGPWSLAAQLPPSPRLPPRSASSCGGV